MKNILIKYKSLTIWVFFLCISCNETLDGIWELEQIKFAPQNLPIEKYPVGYPKYKSNCEINSGYNLLRIQNNAGTVNLRNYLGAEQYDSIRIESKKLTWFANKSCRSTYTFSQKENQIFIFDETGETIITGTKITENEVDEEREFFAKSKVEIKLAKNSENSCTKLVSTDKDIVISIGKSKTKVPGDGRTRNRIILGDQLINETELREFQKNDLTKIKRMLIYADKSTDLKWLTKLIFIKHTFLAFAEDQSEFEICWVDFNDVNTY